MCVLPNLGPLGGLATSGGGAARKGMFGLAGLALGGKKKDKPAGQPITSTQRQTNTLYGSAG